jgi:hypothetical protein
MPITILVMTALSTAAVAFYLRFLFALYKESKPTKIHYWVRVGLGSSQDAIGELRQRPKSVTRAR